jgi:DNA topoisomerase-1
MVIKLGRGGKFLSCSTYPDCDGALTIDGTEIKKDEPIGIDPATNLPIYVLVGRFGPYVQLGEKVEKPKGRKKKGDVTALKPRMASIPKNMDLTKVTLSDALKYLSLPRVLGVNPLNQKDISANVGRFGPYVVCDGDFRSLKGSDNPYDITLERAIEIFSQPKAVRKGGFRFKKTEKK